MHAWLLESIYVIKVEIYLIFGKAKPHSNICNQDTCLEAIYYIYPCSSQSEDMAKFLRQNIHHSLLAAAGGSGANNQKSETPNFPAANKDVLHPQQGHQQPSLTR